MPLYTIDFKLPQGNRTYKRKSLIECFLNELPGEGRGDSASRYHYNVEEYSTYGIFLKRPTQLNKGFDFTVNIKGLYFKKSIRYSNPKHQDIFDALSYCKSKYPYAYDKIRAAIKCIYNCEDIDLSEINAYFCDYLNKEHPIQIILLAIKWLFMEQDCAYWNYSGRKMLFDALEGLKLA